MLEWSQEERKMCSAPAWIGEIVGECPDCGADVDENGEAKACAYSPKFCETCGDAPCDGSC